MLALFALSSCKDEESVDITYGLSCSGDLLKFVSPVVTYVDENGTEQTYTISNEDWNKTGILTIGDDNTSMTVTDSTSYYWTKHIHFDYFGAKGSISVKYIPLSDTEDTTGKQYTFSHNVFIVATAKSDNSQSSSSTSFLTVGFDFQGATVAKYIENLANTVDSKTCVVDRDGAITVK